MKSPLDVETIFLAALEEASPAARAEYLDRACGEDGELRLRLERLLEAHPRAADFLARPAFDRTLADEDDPGDEDDALALLEPSKKPGSLGRLAHYDVMAVLGKGGSATVAKAFDEKLNRLVAVKLMSPILAATSPPRKRFLREARSGAAVRHENVVAIYAVEDRPIPYLAMEYVAGQTLQQKLDATGPLDVRDVLRIGRQIAAGLAAAHATGLVHRDIKPSNILLEDASEVVKITDFGLARAADDASITRSGCIAGTPMYMAPEQALGETIDQSADLFSLGSVLYAMCTGRPPFRAPNMMAVLKRVAEDTPRPIREIIPEVPGWLCDLIARLHAKDPADRPASAQGVADEFARRLAEPRRPDPPHAPRAAKGAAPLGKFLRAAGSILPPRFRTSRWATAAAVLLAFVVGIGLAEASGVTDVRGTVIRLFSPEGTLVVEIDDPGVGVRIDGSDLVIRGARAEEIRLKAGRHTVEATRDGKLVSQELVQVERDGRRVVRVSREPPLEGGKIAEPAADLTDWERSVADLPYLERVKAVIARLKDLNPGLDNISYNEYVDLLIFSPELRDLSPLRIMPGLRGLHLNAANLGDISPLRGMELTRVDLFHTGVSDLSPLESPSLRSLDLSGSTQVTELSPVKAMALDSLTIAYTGVGDLTPLKGTKLTHLNCDSSRVADLSPLEGVPLTKLLVQNTPVSDLSPLRSMPLRELNLNGSAVTDLTPIEGLPLERIDCDFRASRDAKVLRGIVTLKTINGKPAAQFWKEVDAEAEAR